MKVKEILAVTKGKLISGDPECTIEASKISTDSRAINTGGLFIALKGPNFNGEDFIADAFQKGAKGALVMHSIPKIENYNKIVIRARDTTKALQDIAHRHRMKFNIPVIGVTGSNGKTTVKEMFWEVLLASFNVLKNEGTKNNHIGVPQTLLKLDRRHDMCILEMGTNHRGEVRLLGNIARPNIAVITNIGPSHLESLGDLRGVFEAKKEILESLGKGGLAILNGDDRFLATIRRRRFKIVRFGINGSNDVTAAEITQEKDRLRFIVNGKERFVLNLLGLHSVYNALAAIALGRHFNISYASMRRSLRTHKPTCMRLNLKMISGITIIDDSYNSNPLSMQSALDTLKRYPACGRWMVSGDMLELGRLQNDFHRIAGEMIACSGINGLLTFGKFSKHTFSQARLCGMDKKNVWHCATHADIANILKKVAKKGDVILVKGSRAMKMEEVIKRFEGQG